MTFRAIDKWLTYLAVGVILFWLAETAFFIIRDGWHLKAVTPEEKVCDGIVEIGLIAFKLLMYYGIFRLIELAAEHLKE